MNQNDRFGVGLAKISNAKVNIYSDNGYATINATLNDQSVPGDTAFNVPICYPYGMISLPPDNSYVMTLNIAGTTMSPIAVNGIPASNNLFPLDGLDGGDSALYSQRYSLQVTMFGLKAKLDNSNGKNTANLLWGENIVKVLVDIIIQLQDLYDTQLNSVWEQLNNHTHNIVGVQGGLDTMSTNSMAMNGTAITDFNINPELPTDKAEITSGKAYLNDEGAQM